MLFGSLARVLGFIEFIQIRCVQSRASWLSLGSSAGVCFSRVRPGGRWVHLRSLGSLACTLVAVRFIRVNCVHSRRPWGLLSLSVGVEFACARLGGSLGSSGVVRFTLSFPRVFGFACARLRCCAVHPVSLGARPGIDGFIQCISVHSCASWEMFCSLSRSLGVVGFIWDY